MTNKSILSTENLRIGYPRKGEKDDCVLDHLNLEIPAGQVVCVLGPNGSGKSTLIRSLSGLQPVLGGKIRIKGQEVNFRHPKEIARQLSVVLTDKVEVKNLTVYDLVAMGRYPYSKWFGRTIDSDESKIIEALEQVHLQTFARRPLHELSDGELQRAMIAKALAQDTPIILLDEPTAHLDMPNRIRTMQLLRKLANETDKSVLLSTHDHELSLQTADLLWLIKRNQPVQSGLPEDMVLNGSFEETFVSDNVRFDPESGTYKILYSTPYRMKLKGDSVIGFWTKRAFERQGIYLGSEVDADFCIHLQEENPRWGFGNPSHPTHHFFSIQALLEFILKNSYNFEEKLI